VQRVIFYNADCASSYNRSIKTKYNKSIPMIYVLNYYILTAYIFKILKVSKIY
jgi:hypothetical protein